MIAEEPELEREARRDGHNFMCPYGCEGVTDSMHEWVEHMREEHGVEGPL